MKLQYRRLRAPKLDNQVLIDPPLDEFKNTLAQNQSRIRNYQFQIAGESIETLRINAQAELLRKASEYSGRYLSEIPDAAGSTIFLSGHQPQLFHPGVWFKNFVLASVARENGAVGINFIVDNDLGTSTRILVPANDLNEPQIRSIGYDVPRPMQPFEGRAINDLGLWSEFEKRVSETLRPFVANPIIANLWQEVTDLLESRTVDGPEYAIAAARHRLEHRKGLSNLELPLSWICQSCHFSKLVAEIVERGHEFVQVHNQVLDEYRHLHRIRSSAHPVPALAIDGDWLELPFWCWSQTRPRRSPLWVRFETEFARLSNRDDVEIEIPIERLADSLSELETQQGICIRPRALITTMYSRLVLSDVFLHGIGGAKYDQLTDSIIAEFFQVEAPEYFTISSTHFLPIDFEAKSQADVAQAAKKIRDHEFHPEYFLDGDDPDSQELIERKNRWLSQIPPKGEKKDWHREMDSINAAIRSKLNMDLGQLKASLAETRKAVRRTNVLRSREFSFCLFPESITDQLADLSRL